MKQHSPQSMFAKNNIIFLASIIIIILLIIIKLPLSKLSKSDPIPADKFISYDAPEIPSTYVWQKADRSSQKLNIIHWKDTESNERGTINLEGEEWFLNREVQSFEEQYDNTIYEQFTKTLTIRNGWHQTFSSLYNSEVSNIKIGKYKLYGNILSPTILNKSFIKYSKEKIRIINYYEHSEDRALIKHTGSIDYKYPHMIEYRIFISKLYEDSELLKKISEINNK